MRFFCVALCLFIFSCLPDETSSVHPQVGGCVCPVKHRHPQDYFCIAAFVMKAKIKKIMTDGSFRKYKINNNPMIYRTRPAWDGVPNGEKKFIYTKLSKASCGLPDLVKNQVYLFAGQVYLGKKPYISQCQWVEKWSKLTNKQRDFITNPLAYNSVCGQCSVSYAGCDKCEDCFSESVCDSKEFPTLAKSRCAEKGWLPWERECYEKYSHCRWCPGSACMRCRWVTNDDFEACLKRYSKIPGGK